MQVLHWTGEARCDEIKVKAPVAGRGMAEVRWMPDSDLSGMEELNLSPEGSL